MKIFLDIDGVMVHANPNIRVENESDGFYKFNQVAVEKLNLLLSSDDEIILSTTHRFRFNLEKWLKILTNRGINVTKVSRILLQVNELNRKDEIMYWISEKNFQPDEFLIIDDDKSLNDLPELYKENLILTNPLRGLE